jgi:hypothetical protein
VDFVSLSPKLRFEVFKRDGFTCQYCGRKTPQVVLEVDHIIPRAEGGGDEMTNLVTSCYECNRGKGAGLLDDRAPVTDMHEQAVLMLEREMQLKEYNEVKRQVRERIEDQICELFAYWDQVTQSRNRKTLDPGSIRSFLNIFAMEDIKEAIDVAVDNKGIWVGPNYVYAILHRWRKEQTREVD